MKVIIAYDNGAMKIFDKQFLRTQKSYILQSLYAALFMFITLVVLGSLAKEDILGAIGASALAASTFLIFVAPHSAMAQPRNIFGGYLIGMLCGACCHFAQAQIDIIPSWLDHILYLNRALYGAIAIGLATFLMSILDAEHPPAAGLTLGLVLENWNSNILGVVLCGLCFLALFRHIRAKQLSDLL